MWQTGTPPSPSTSVSSTFSIMNILPFFSALSLPLSPSPNEGGGLLTEKYLGRAEPKSRAELNTASLGKYKNMVDMWGGWGLFQELLAVLDTVAKGRSCSIASVATRYILDQPAVGGVIVGCRLGVPGAEHIEDTLRSCALELRPEDVSAINGVLQRSRDLMRVTGDCGGEYR